MFFLEWNHNPLSSCHIAFPHFSESRAQNHSYKYEHVPLWGESRWGHSHLCMSCSASGEHITLYFIYAMVCMLCRWRHSLWHNMCFVPSRKCPWIMFNTEVASNNMKITVLSPRYRAAGYIIIWVSTTAAATNHLIRYVMFILMDFIEDSKCNGWALSKSSCWRIPVCL